MSRKRKKPVPSLDLYKEHLKYDPKTGHFTWRILGRFPYNRRKPGPVGHSSTPGGRKTITCFQVSIRTDQLAWAFLSGHWPSQEIRHVNGIDSDDSRSNLALGKKPRLAPLHLKTQVTEWDGAVSKSRADAFKCWATAQSDATLVTEFRRCERFNIVFEKRVIKEELLHRYPKKKDDSD